MSDQLRKSPLRGFLTSSGLESVAEEQGFPDEEDDPVLTSNSLFMAALKLLLRLSRLFSDEAAPL